MTPNGPQQNLVYLTEKTVSIRRFDAKIDRQFSPNYKIFGRYSQVSHRSLQSGTSLGGAQYTPELLWRLVDPVMPLPTDQRNVAISQTSTWSPTTINELRLGYNRRRENRVPPSYNQGWAKQLGIPNVGPETFPQFNPSFASMGPGGRYQKVAEDFMLQ